MMISGLMCSGTCSTSVPMTSMASVEGSDRARNASTVARISVERYTGSVAKKSSRPTARMKAKWLLTWPIVENSSEITRLPVRI